MTYLRFGNKTEPLTESLIRAVEHDLEIGFTRQSIANEHSISLSSVARIKKNMNNKSISEYALDED